MTQFLVGPLSRLGWVGAMLARARASADRLAEALAAPPAVRGGRRRGRRARRRAGRRSSVDGLRHGPLDGLALDVAAGSVHGVAVADPAAAEALLDCLGREAEPAAGSIAVGGDAADRARARRPRGPRWSSARTSPRCSPTP